MIYSIGELNAAFMKQLEEQREVKRTHNWKRITGIMTFLLLVMIMILWRTVTYDQNRNGDLVRETIAEVDFLVDGERQRWQTKIVDQELIPIELHQEIEVYNQRAFTRIINPIYSTYTVKVKMIPKGSEKEILYESERLSPGTVLEAVQLTTELKAQETEIIIEYLIYDQEGEILGTYPVEARLLQMSK